jgi:hypothetical protein
MFQSTVTTLELSQSLFWIAQVIVQPQDISPAQASVWCNPGFCVSVSIN